jgi:hypothetical protein
MTNLLLAVIAYYVAANYYHARGDKHPEISALATLGGMAIGFLLVRRLFF